MKPTDLRRLAWHDVLPHLTQDLVRVHLAWQAHGPGTTRQVAQRSGISLLTLRPRTTDLFKLGLVELTGSERAEGVYAYQSRLEAETSGAWRERADFSSTRPAPTTDEPAGYKLVGFGTVDDAVNSLTPAEQAALGARLMGKWGHLGKKRTSAAGAQQLELLHS